LFSLLLGEHTGFKNHVALGPTKGHHSRGCGAPDPMNWIGPTDCERDRVWLPSREPSAKLVLVNGSGIPSAAGPISCHGTSTAPAPLREEVERRTIFGAVLGDCLTLRNLLQVSHPHGIRNGGRCVRRSSGSFPWWLIIGERARVHRGVEYTRTLCRRPWASHVVNVVQLWAFVPLPYRTKPSSFFSPTAG